MSAFYIPKPCHENWNSMSPQEKGRHCAVCSTTVVDFTKKTPAQVAEVVASAEGTVCGHFTINQLDAKAQAKVFRNPLNIFNKNWKYFAMSVFGLFFMNKKTVAQETMGKIKMRGMVKPTHNANTQTSTITGTVTDPSGNRLSNANVTITSNGKEIANLITDVDGKYMVKIEPGKIENKKITVHVYHNFYESKIVKDLGIYKYVTTLNIQMEMEMMLMGIVEEIRIPEPPIQNDTITPIPIDTVVIEKNDITKICALTQDTSQVGIVTGVDTTNQIDQRVVDKTIPNLTILDEEIKASIYPNPTGNIATVYLTNSNNYTIDVISLSGAMVQNHEFTGDKLKLDVSKLERGTYFVRVNDETGTLNTLKLIKN